MKKELRESILERDDHTCQLDKIFGISELTGVPCSEELEVHHKTYDRAGDEDPEDLIIVCKRCHELLTDGIRRERYLHGKDRLTLPSDAVQRLPNSLGGIPDEYTQEDKILDHRRVTTDHELSPGYVPWERDGGTEVALDVKEEQD